MLGAGGTSVAAAYEYLDLHLPWWLAFVAVIRLAFKFPVERTWVVYCSCDVGL